MHLNHALNKNITLISLSLFAICFSLLLLPAQNSYAESKPESLKGTKMKDRTVLAPCPKKPNCVNSQNVKDKKHSIKALQTTDLNVEKNRDNLLEVINKFPRVKFIVSDENYIKAEFTSKWFKFVDDVEFVISASQIDVRSASRKGYSDLRANRKRVEKIRRLLDAQQ